MDPQAVTPETDPLLSSRLEPVRTDLAFRASGSWRPAAGRYTRLGSWKQGKQVGPSRGVHVARWPSGQVLAARPATSVARRGHPVRRPSAERGPFAARFEHVGFRRADRLVRADVRGLRESSRVRRRPRLGRCVRLGQSAERVRRDLPSRRLGSRLAVSMARPCGRRSSAPTGTCTERCRPRRHTRFRRRETSRLHRDGAEVDVQWLSRKRPRGVGTS
jgi:hypothetical protein